MVDAICSAGMDGGELLDIGGGVGTIQHLLLARGAARATHVDVSQAYIDAARKEGERRGHLDRMTARAGDFVDLAPSMGQFDVVTLDRVICCYPDMRRLVRASASKAERLYGLVYPRSGSAAELVARMANTLMRLRRSDFRAYIHDTGEVDALVRSLGFERSYESATAVWQIFLYRRSGAQAPTS
ncbi:MAG: class I SAM-dependent methyltransferase [Gemmatimonadota bacterium]